MKNVRFKVKSRHATGKYLLDLVHRDVYYWILEDLHRPVRGYLTNLIGDTMTELKENEKYDVCH